MKPEVTLNTTKLVIPIVKLTATLTLAREIYDDWDSFANYALIELQKQVIDVENTQLLNGGGTGTDMLGFYNISGILTFDASTVTSTPGRGTRSNTRSPPCAKGRRWPSRT